MELGGFIDRKRKGLRYRQSVVVLGRRIPFRVEQGRRRCFEALEIVGKREAEARAIGGSLLMGERETAYSGVRLIRRTEPTAPVSRSRFRLHARRYSVSDKA